MPRHILIKGPNLLLGTREPHYFLSNVEGAIVDHIQTAGGGGGGEPVVIIINPGGHSEGR